MFQRSGLGRIPSLGRGSGTVSRVWTWEDSFARKRVGTVSGVWTWEDPLARKRVWYCFKGLDLGGSPR